MFAQKLAKMRKILIPTDFTVESLQLVEYATLNYPDSTLDIILIAGCRLPHSYWGIRHFNEKEQVYNQISNQFIDSKYRLQLEHKNTINSISIRLFTGVNSSAFQNFVENLDVVDAVVPRPGILCGTKNWFDTTEYIKRNIQNVVEVVIEQPKEVQETPILIKKPVQV